MADERRSFWQRTWRTSEPQHAPREQQTDPADMGTAFGLDATFDLPTACASKPTSTPAETSLLESLWAINRLNGRSII